MRVILTTGGTGGHVFPALAVAQALRERNPGIDLLFVGAQYGREAEWAAQAGLEFAGLAVRGIAGRGMRSFGAMKAMFQAVRQARALVEAFRPDCVAGFGGYAAFPSMLAGWLAGTPLLVHEQNAWPGLANRVLGRLARAVCLSMPGSERAFGGPGTIMTGNPVRKAIVRLGSGAQAGHPDRKKRLLVLGGSLGARFLNDAVVAMLPALAEKGISVRHQTGASDYERVRELYARMGLKGEAVAAPFIEDMAEAYAWADLVLCRAGATTIAELTISGKPAFFVPFPFAARNHQVGNAEALVRAGAAQMMEEREIASAGQEVFARRVAALLDDAPALLEMGRAARALGRPEAAESVAAVIESLDKGAPRRA